jgi:hypothetical protein
MQRVMFARLGPRRGLCGQGQSFGTEGAMVSGVASKGVPQTPGKRLRWLFLSEAFTLCFDSREARVLAELLPTPLISHLASPQLPARKYVCA